MKKSETKRAKATAWKWFSKYIKLRDCLATRNSTEECKCVTCGAIVSGRLLHAGHAIGGRNDSILFDEELVNGQCLTKESRLKMSDGSYKPINEIKVGDKLSAFDDKTFEEKTSVVIKSNSFVPNKLFEVTMADGSVFYATGDHKVLSNGCFIEVRDMLHDVSAHNIIEYD